MFSGLTGSADAGSLTDGIAKRRISEAAASTFSENGFLSIRLEIGEKISRFDIFHQCSLRNQQNDVFSTFTRAIGRAPLFAIVSLEVATLADVVERVQIFAGFKDDVSTAATISTGWTSTRHVFLTTEGDHAVTAFSGGNFNLGFVEEHGGGKVSFDNRQRP